MGRRMGARLAVSVLPTSFASQLAHDIEHGVCCASCHEYFSVAYGAPTICTTICWTRTPPDERAGFLKADRDTEERVIAGKQLRVREAAKRAQTPPTNENA